MFGQFRQAPRGERGDAPVGGGCPSDQADVLAHLATDHPVASPAPFWVQCLEPSLVEGVDDIAHIVGADLHQRGDVGHRLALRGHQHDDRPPQLHRVFRGPADPLQPAPFLHAHRPDEHSRTTPHNHLHDHDLETACRATDEGSITRPKIRDGPLEGRDERQRKAHSSWRIRGRVRRRPSENWRAFTRWFGRREHMCDTVQAVAGLLPHQQTADSGPALDSAGASTEPYRVVPNLICWCWCWCTVSPSQGCRELAPAVESIIPADDTSSSTIRPRWTHGNQAFRG